MKITANIPDDLMAELKSLAKKKTVTEAIVVALSEWVASKALREKHRSLREKPLEFTFDAEEIREVNRK